MKKRELEKELVTEENGGSIAKATQPAKYSKEELIGSKKYADKADLLNTVLDAYKKYTTKEADAIIESFLKSKIK